MHADTPRSSVALAFRAILAEQNSTSTINLVPALAALNESTYYEGEIMSPCDGHKTSHKVKTKMGSTFSFENPFLS